MFGFFYSFFSINELNKPAKNFILKSTLVYYLFTFLIYFAQIFVILHALTIVVTLDRLAILMAVMLFTEAVFAIPAGSLGDVRGQKYILIFSSLFYALAYYLLISANTFETLIVVFFSLGLASSFDLENFYSFFDKNYSHFAYEDVDRSIYRKFNAKFFMFRMIVSSISFLVGALIANYVSRNTAFYVVIYGLLLTIIAKFFLLRDHENAKRKDSIFSFYSKIKGGLTHSITNFRLLLFIIGSVIVTLTYLLWENLFSILLYNDLGKSDDLTGAIMSVVVLLTAIVIGLLGNISSKFKRVKLWYQFSVFLSSLVFFGGLVLFLNNVSIPNAIANVSLIIMFLVIFVIIIVPYQLSELLYFVIMMDMAKEEYRGQIYAIIPAIRGLIAGTLLFVGSEFISSNDLSEIFIVLALIGFIGSIVIIISLIGFKVKIIATSSLSFFSSYMLKRQSDMSDFVHISVHESIIDSEEKITGMLQRITKVALSDTFITEDEKTLIDIVSSDLQGYIAILSDYKNVFLTDTVTDEQKKEKKEFLETYKKRIWENAYQFSLREEGISEDLLNILFELSDILKHDL